MAIILQLADFNQHILIHYQVFFTISHTLWAAFFVRPMPQEIIFAPDRLVTAASNFKAFCYHIL
jgi:hypothetical protein